MELFAFFKLYSSAITFDKCFNFSHHFKPKCILKFEYKTDFAVCHIIVFILDCGGTGNRDIIFNVLK